MTRMWPTKLVEKWSRSWLRRHMPIDVFEEESVDGQKGVAIDEEGVYGEWLEQRAICAGSQVKFSCKR